MVKPSTGSVEYITRSGRIDKATISLSPKPDALACTIPHSNAMVRRSPWLSLIAPSKRFVSPMKEATKRVAGCS